LRNRDSRKNIGLNFGDIFVIRKALTFSFLLVATALTAPVLANIVIQGNCPRDMCLDQQFLGKTLVQRGSDGNLLSVQVARREWSRLFEQPGAFGPSETQYFYCSTTRPAVIYPSDGGGFSVTTLNPGRNPADLGYYSSFDSWAYQLYWVTCHNFVGPNFFSAEMTRRALQLGYPLNLARRQFDISNLNEIVR
jgi:hypothetical protein